MKGEIALKEEKQKRNPYEALVVQNLEAPVVDMSWKQMEQWSILHNEIKHVQYSDHPIGDYVLQVKAPEKRYDTKMYKRLQVAQKDRLKRQTSTQILRGLKGSSGCI